VDAGTLRDDRAGIGPVTGWRLRGLFGGATADFAIVAGAPPSTGISFHRHSRYAVLLPLDFGLYIVQAVLETGVIFHDRAESRRLASGESPHESEA
jgi:hypothetical protein